MKVVITGASGQDGIFLTDKILRETNAEVYACTRKKNNFDFKKLQYLKNQEDMSRVKIVELDYLNYDEIYNFLADAKPNFLYNLMGPSSVKSFIENPIKMTDETINSFKNITNALINTKFQTDKNVKVFICSLLAGGIGIDLTAASTVIHYDRWWNPSKENQATDRVHRIGQSRGVQVFKMVTKGTIEEHIHKIIEKKIGLPRDKIIITVNQHGNTSAASIPLAFDHANAKDTFKSGEYIMLEAFGAGFTWGSILLKY